MKHILDSLKQGGYQVNISYHREYDGNGMVMGKGGVTEVELIKGDKVSCGTAKCSKKDNFCRSTGRMIALKRALETFKQV